jgi:hypothetical protein
MAILEHLTDCQKNSLPLPHRMAPECRFRLERAREPRRAPKQFGDPRADRGPVRQLEGLEQGPQRKD